jgi:hypothetical protein
MGDRQKSNTIIVPKGNVLQTERPKYPPEDARAMSPRRNSQDIEKLEQGVRQSLKEYVGHRYLLTLVMISNAPADKPRPFNHHWQPSPRR